jgi:hypothetical protein
MNKKLVLASALVFGVAGLILAQGTKAQDAAMNSDNAVMNDENAMANSDNAMAPADNATVPADNMAK